MRCHIIVSLESIECVESHRWPNKTPAQNCVSTGRQKDCPIAATLKRKLLTKGKFSDRQNAIVALSILSDLILRGGECFALARRILRLMGSKTATAKLFG